jgi:3-hydroxyisobutyrate dehydrogenase
VVTCIGFIGVGRMGLPMCANLAAGGYAVVAGDARADLEGAVLACGAAWAGTLAGVAARADILITMLPGPAAVTGVMAGPGGVLAAMPAGATWIDMTSNSPRTAQPLTAAARARGIGVLDAPAGGGPPAARAGMLQLFVGGDGALLDRCRPVLEVLADPQRITHVGGSGCGYLAKLLVNLLWFGQAVATAEALLLASASGIDLDVLRQALAGSAASSAFIVNDLGALLDGDYLRSFRAGPLLRGTGRGHRARPRPGPAQRADAAGRADLPAGPPPLRAGQRGAPGRGPAGRGSRDPAASRSCLTCRAHMAEEPANVVRVVPARSTMPAGVSTACTVLGSRVPPAFAD